MTGSQREQAQSGLGYSLAFSEQHAEARHIFEQLCLQATVRSDAEAEHRAVHQIGMVERMAGDWRAAQTCFEQERRLIESLGEPDLAVAVNAYELGLVALHLGEMTSARRWLDLSLERARRTADRTAVGCAWRALGDWHRQRGDSDGAQECWTAARAAFERAGDAKAGREMVRRLELKGESVD